MLLNKIVGVMGPGKTASDLEKRFAYTIGRIIAQKKHTLLSGGMAGTMLSACAGAHQAGGLVIGIGPTADADDMNQYVAIPIVTGLGGARNYINILTSDKVVAVGVGSGGTLSEVGFAIQQKRPLLVVLASEVCQMYLKEIQDPDSPIQFVDDEAFLVEKLETFLG